jgi:hypothetical protein
MKVNRLLKKEQYSMEKAVEGYDIIGDIHGHADELKVLLEKMDYRHNGQYYSHPTRTAIFLGDFIDRGPKQRDVINIVMPMEKSGAAMSVMANHEFNALCYHTANPDKPGEWLRPRNKKNTGQHQAFLDEYLTSDKAEELQAALAWFKTLPLWIETDGIRIVHACWHEESIEALKLQLGPNNTITDELLVRASVKGSSEYNAVEVLLKGWEVRLDDGVSFQDKDGNERHEVRTKWWLKERTLLKEAAIAEPDIIKALPESEWLDPDKFIGYDESEPPLFLGHYWLIGEPKPLEHNIACLDYSVAKDGKLVAYRWDEEKSLTPNGFYWVGRQDLEEG